jgi:hypothetical protein
MSYVSTSPKDVFQSLKKRWKICACADGHEEAQSYEDCQQSLRPMRLIARTEVERYGSVHGWR